MTPVIYPYERAVLLIHEGAYKEIVQQFSFNYILRLHCKNALQSGSEKGMPGLLRPGSELGPYSLEESVITPAKLVHPPGEFPSETIKNKKTKSIN